MRFMDKQTKTKIKNLALVLRDDLEKEIENRLDNIGIYPDKEWKDGRSLTHLSKDEIEKRKRVAAFIKREEKIGLDQRKATSEFIKEASYTWINRLLGLKCMECRGLIDEVITTRPEYGGRSKRHRDFRDKNPDKAVKPDDALTACLFSAFEEVTEEIKVLFDPKNEYSLVIPRYPTLKKAIEKINTELDYNTYREDEFLGWVYQYFNSREKDRVFEELRTRKKKISGSDIINVTQLYTEKYMVRFLVENSLGAMWMEMYPDSQLCNKWEYFVKDPNNSRRDPKPVKEIKFLDPAGGSGHFQLYAFDLFYDMYLEEGIIPEEHIPEFILRYNLHGIDIDLRAIQLSALGLYMKARSKNPDIKVQHMNLVSADAIMLDSAILEEFLQEFKDDKTAQELIKTIWKGLENVRELGSLLKVEEQIDEVIKRQKDKRLDFFGEGKEKGWEMWKRDLLAALKRYYEKAAQTFDINKQMFANEACKGVQLLDLLEQRYDVVATNPPYMNIIKGNQILMNYLRENYKDYNQDLYTVFIRRNFDFASAYGFISMVTMHNFMFIDTSKNLRKFILKNSAIRTLAHLGTNAFVELRDHAPAVLFSLKKEAPNETYFGKFSKLTEDIDKSKSLKQENNFYNVNPINFLKVVNQPFVYWVSENILNLNSKFQNLNNYADIKTGMRLKNIENFTRFHWEVEASRIGYEWVMFANGGISIDYYGGVDTVLLWNERSKVFYDTNNCHRNPDFYFKPGLTWSNIVSVGNKFTIKLLPPKSVFDGTGNYLCHKSESKNNYLVGFMNSRLITYILSYLNPTLHYNINDLARVPFKPPSIDIECRISELAQQCVNVKKDALQFVINDREFKQTAIQWGYRRSF
jgi:hypothetical protein